MIHLEINGNIYKAFEKWDEITLEKAVEIHALCKKEIPHRLNKLYQAMAFDNNEKELQDVTSQITEKDLIKHFPLFYGKVIGLMSDIPQEVIEHLNAGERKAFYDKYCFSFLYGILLAPVNYNYKSIKSFEFEDKTYWLPETKMVMGAERPFFDRTIIEFTEAADLQVLAKDLEGGKYDVAANIVSILCRPKTENGVIEKYNELICIERAEAFKKLTMDIVFEVFFCFKKHIDLSELHTEVYLQEETLKAQKLILQAD